MQIAIDLQALQSSGSKDRGIGRYSKSLIRHLIHIDSSSHSYQFYANKLLSSIDLNEIDRKSLVSYREVDYFPEESSVVNDLLLETYLGNEAINGALILSPMEGGECKIPKFKALNKPTFTILYDLIPFIFAEQYFLNLPPEFRQQYLARLNNIKNASFIFTISEATRQDAIKYAGIDENKTLNISTGVSSNFTPLNKNEREEWTEKLKNKHGVDRPFILYTGGEDWRKNLRGLIQAFSRLPQEYKHKYQLVIACRISKDLENTLLSFAKQLGVTHSLVFTNYVPDEDLRALYSICSLFVFPSYYEGFGLPLAEAMACGAPSIASNNSSLLEIVASTEQLFDPYNIEEIARSMHTILSDDNISKHLSELGLRHSEQFGWQNVAQKVVSVFNEFDSSPQSTLFFGSAFTKISPSKKKLAYFSPLFPSPSGVADYSAQLINHLHEFFALDLCYFDNEFIRQDQNLKYTKYSDFEKTFEDEIYSPSLFHIGNSEYHHHIFMMLLRYPGISVLHDYNISGLINSIAHHHPNAGVSLRGEFEHNYGENAAVYMTENTHHLFQGKDYSELEIYLNRRVFTRSLGVILHSRWAYEHAISAFSCDNENIIYIPHIVTPFSSSGTNKLSLGFPEDSFIIGVFGGVALQKRPFSILRAFKRFHLDFPNSYLIFVGELSISEQEVFQDDIVELGIDGHVKLFGYVDSQQFNDLIDVSDICLNLRYPFYGETSGALLKLLSAAKPVVVTDIGSFSDLPNDVVHKIPIPSLCNEIEEIYKALLTLKNNHTYSKNLGINALNHVSVDHSPEKCALLYKDFIDSVYKSSASHKKIYTDYLGRKLSSIPFKNAETTLTTFKNYVAKIDSGTSDKSHLISCLCTQSQLELPLFKNWAVKLGEPPNRLHRKVWEWCYIAQALFERQMLQQGKSGLGFAVGQEPLVSLFASYGCQILATDLFEDEAREQGWVDSQQHSNNTKILNQSGICPQALFDERVDFRNLNMNEIPPELTGYDFIWSSCSFEHLGSLELGLDFVLNAMDCLKPGGYAVHTTEFNLSSEDETLSEGGTVLYRKRDILKLAKLLRMAGHKVCLNFTTGDDPVDKIIDVPPYKQDNHLKLQIDRFVITSLGLIIQKNPNP